MHASPPLPPSSSKNLESQADLCRTPNGKSRELAEIRKQFTESLSRESDERFTQIEALGRRMEAESSESTERHKKVEECKEKIADLVSSQEQLAAAQTTLELEYKSQRALLQSERRMQTRELQNLEETLSKQVEESFDKQTQNLVSTERFEMEIAQVNAVLKEKLQGHHVPENEPLTSHQELLTLHKKCESRQESCVCELESLSITSDRLVNQGKDHSTRINNLEALYKELEASYRDLSTAQLHSLETKKSQGEHDETSLADEFQVLKTGMKKLFGGSEEYGARLAELERENHELIQGVESTCQELKQRQNDLESLLDSERELRKEQASDCQDRCMQLEESVGRLDTMTAELALNYSHEKIHEQFESLLAVERTAMQEFVGTEGVALAESLNKMVTELISQQNEKFSAVEERIGAGASQINVLHKEINDKFSRLQKGE